MNSAILKTLKNNFVNASTQNNRSTIELCITELSSGNFPKAVDLSEELIKRNIDDSVGWAMKALAQAHLFDYNNNLYFLKSSQTSLDEFKTKTTLSLQEITNVEAIFFTTVLDRTIVLVSQRVEEVIELRRKAMAEKSKANAAGLGAVISAYAGIQSKSEMGEIFGFGGAIAGSAAHSHFNSNAVLLNSASKGVFGVAVTNIAFTIGSAMTLKNSLNELYFDVRNEATNTLKNWINTLAFIYQQVITNLLIYGRELKAKNVFTKSFRLAAIDMINAPEAIQFVYLSKILGIENTIPQYKDIEIQMASMREINENEIKSSVTNMHIIGGLSLVFTMFLASAFPKDNGGLILITIGTYLYLMFKPIGKAGELKQLVTQFVETVENFKITSDKIIVENMIPHDKSLNE